ncbi:hypothetical protein [Pseudomonas nunensis]|uniref:hypothetical protein n=1 Tax=Pseudomonas nunensis TaxID=2961896 RepID=UPI0025B03DED|nr:hypothetical protein [Pseudomonas nunensis]MDN3221352.1 hypothetical protein [Pseudomonas nunensis]
MAGEIDWAPLVQSLAATNWTAVLVGVFSAFAALVGPVRLWKKQMKRESESVRASLFAEVGAMVEMVDRRGFLPALRNTEALLSTRQSSAQSIFNPIRESFEVVIDSEFNKVYQANLSKLGVLSVEEARQIVRFHQLANGVRLDVIPGGVIARGTSNPETFKETADLLEAAMDIGRELTAPKPKSLSKWQRFWVANK